MTNKRSIKRALFASIVSLLLCFTMLFGTTYAWFTDSVTSSNNKIVAGNLDVELHMNIDGNGYTNISEDETPIFGPGSFAQDNNASTLWEPGKTQVAYLMIKNNGSLALKYTVALKAYDSEKDLYTVLEYVITPDAKYGEVTAWDNTNAKTVQLGTQTVSNGEGHMKPGDEHYFALSIHMLENAGNDFMEGSISFDITVLATQDTVESDSFNNRYDKDALYAVDDDLYVDNTTGEYVAFSTKGLSNLAALADKDSSITSVTYASETGDVEVPVVADRTALESAVASGSRVVVLKSGSYTVDQVKNTTVTIVGTKDTTVAVSNESAGGSDGSGVDYGFEGATVIFEGITIDTTAQSGDYRGYARMKATYNNCTFIGSYTVFDNSVFNNCTFDTRNGYVWATWGGSSVEFNNCTFNSDVAKAILVHGGISSTVTVKDCSFTAKTAAYTWNKLYVAAVSIDPANANTTYNVNFVGNNTVTVGEGAAADSFGNIGFDGLYQVKDAAESSQVTITVEGETVTNPIAGKFE